MIFIRNNIFLALNGAEYYKQPLLNHRILLILLVTRRQPPKSQLHPSRGLYVLCWSWCSHCCSPVSHFHPVIHFHTQFQKERTISLFRKHETWIGSMGSSKSLHVPAYKLSYFTKFVFTWSTPGLLSVRRTGALSRSDWVQSREPISKAERFVKTRSFILPHIGYMMSTQCFLANAWHTLCLWGSFSM